jgi:phospholipase/carboxylesterase
VAPTLLACGDDATGLEEAPNRVHARVGEPNLIPELGPSPLGLGQPRDGFLYVPTSYSPATPAPLFVALHGAGGAADNWTGYFNACENRGMVLLAVDSRGSTWDLVRGDFGRDVRFLDRALEYTFSRCVIDPSHIALAGFSDGASYALSLGLSNGDLFTHLLGYSPGFMAPEDPLVGKPRIFISHGFNDSVLPVANSRHSFVPSLREAGYDVTYQEFAGGHEVLAAVGTASLDWFQGLPPSSLS